MAEILSLVESNRTFPHIFLSLLVFELEGAAILTPPERRWLEAQPRRGLQRKRDPFLYRPAACLWSKPAPRNQKRRVAVAGDNRDSSCVVTRDVRTNSALSHFSHHGRSDLPRTADLSTENLSKRATKCA